MRSRSLFATCQLKRHISLAKWSRARALATPATQTTGQTVPPTAPFEEAPTQEDKPLEETVPVDSITPTQIAQLDSTLSPPPPLPPLPTAGANTGSEPVASLRRPVGAFRGGLIGFLLGTSIVGAYGYFALLEDYAEASKTLLLSVEELKSSTSQLTSHLTRVSALEGSLSQLESKVKTLAARTELDSMRAEYKGLIESEHLDYLSLKAHLWGVEQDLNALTKRSATQVRI
ncbi:hypothetical protein T439DRAFT_73685 [Meredithblackwellia eburnea MCA 4105]